TVLRALLLADSVEGERAFSAIHRGDRVAAGDAVVCVHGRAFGSHRPQVDHDARMFARCDLLLSNLPGDAACGRIECRDYGVAAKSCDRRDQSHSADGSERAVGSGEGSAALYRLRHAPRIVDRVEVDLACVRAGVLCDDGLWTNRGLSG